jgi:hypothetical protein
MRVEGVNNFFVFFENLKVERPVDVLTKEEMEYFESVFNEKVEEIRSYYDSNGRQIFDTGKFINKKV